MICKLIDGVLPTEIGEFREVLYSDGKDTAICLVYGNVIRASSLILRIHSHCISSHVFFYTGCDCREQMRKSQELIVAEGSGMIIWLDQEGRSNGHLAKIASEVWKKSGMSQSDAYVAAGFKADARDYSLAIKILQTYEPQSILLLTSNPSKTSAVETLGVPVLTRTV